jgi:hypothetical protein
VVAHADRHGRRVPVRPEGSLPPEAELLRQAQLLLRRELAVAAGAAGRHEIGVDHLCWGGDTRTLRRHLSAHGSPCATPSAAWTAGGPRDTRQNAAKLYGFDLAELQKHADQFGPTPDDVARPLAPEEFPKDAHTMAFSS